MSIPNDYKPIPNAPAYALTPSNKVVRISSHHVLKRHLAGGRWFSRLQVDGRTVRFFHDEIETGVDLSVEGTNESRNQYLRELIHKGVAKSLKGYGGDGRDFSNYYITPDKRVLRLGHDRRRNGPDHVHELKPFVQTCGVSESVSLCDAITNRSVVRRLKDLHSFVFGAGE